ncbi:MAG: MqnA/MqnD/SBP family protein [Clostridia bacterium]
MKKFFALLLSLCLIVSLGMLPSTVLAEDAAAIRLGGLKGPTTMGMVKLLEDSEKGLTATPYEFTMAGSADELTPKLLKGELDILAVPANLGSILYNNTDGAVQMLAINALGVMYICEKGGNTIKSIEDLKGQTIYSTGKGSTPEFVLSYLLSQHGLTMDTDVKMEWTSEPTETVANLAAKEHAVAMLPQPFVTVAQAQVEGLSIALDLNKEWEALEGDSLLVTAGLIARKAFVEENPEAVAQFLQEYQASAEWINANVEEGAKLVEKYGIVKAPIAQKAIPACNIVCISGADMKAATQGYFEVLFAQKPEAVGGKLPSDDFYYAK